MHKSREKSKEKNYREFKTGNLKFELFNLISSPKKNVRKNEDGDKYIVRGCRVVLIMQNIM